MKQRLANSMLNISSGSVWQMPRKWQFNIVESRFFADLIFMFSYLFDWSTFTRYLQMFGCHNTCYRISRIAVFLISISHWRSHLYSEEKDKCFDQLWNRLKWSWIPWSTCTLKVTHRSRSLCWSQMQTQTCFKQLNWYKSMISPSLWMHWSKWMIQTRQDHRIAVV